MMMDDYCGITLYVHGKLKSLVDCLFLTALVDSNIHSGTPFSPRQPTYSLRSSEDIWSLNIGDLINALELEKVKLDKPHIGLLTCFLGNNIRRPSKQITAIKQIQVELLPSFNTYMQ